MKELDKKYRPVELDEVVGQIAIVSSIKKLFLSDRFPHSFLLTGPSGVGKTTIARILASMVEAADTIEVDGASYTGVDDMREIADNLRYRSFIGTGIKFLILDEAHMLSKNAWNSWLKIVEEPPKHVYFAFCTTEPAKVPNTIKTRCHTYQLKTLSIYELEGLLNKVVVEEKFHLEEGIADLILKECDGSARQMLIYLSQLHNLSLEGAKAVLLFPEESRDAIQLCKLLIRGSSQMELINLLKDLKTQGVNPYSLKIQAVNYLTGCVLNSRNQAETLKFLSMLEAFNNTPMDQNIGFAAITLATLEIFLKNKK